MTMIRTMTFAGAMALMAVPALAQVRLSHHFPPTHPSAQAIDAFAADVAARTGGALTIEVFPAGQILSPRDVMGGVASGSVQMGVAVGLISFPAMNRDYAISALPGLFDSFEALRGFFAETPEGQRIWSSLTTDLGLLAVGDIPSGPSAVYSAREDLSSATSFQGTSARVLTDADRPRWEALGVGRMVSVPTGEVYTALQSGMIDTLASVPGAVNSNSWWDFLNAVQLPWFVFADGHVLANAAWFAGLPDDHQQAIRDAGAAMSATTTAGIMAVAEAQVAQFAARGGQVFTLEGEALDQLRALEAERVWPAMAAQLSPGVLDAAVAYMAGR